MITMPLKQGQLRAAMAAGLAFILWGEIAHSGILGLHGIQLATAIALAAAATGWIGWAVTGPRGTSVPLTVFVCWTGVAGSALLFVHPAPAVCWFTLWACVDAGAAQPARIGLPLAGVCCGILLAGYLLHRGDLLATLAAVAFVAYIVGRNRRDHARAAMLAERGRIAAELHDILGHSLTALSLHVQAASAALETIGDRDHALLQLAKAARLARSGQEETVAAVRTLRDGAVGVHELFKNLIDSSGLTADLAVHGKPRPLSPTTGMAVYRLLQEALTNAGKHAPGTDAAVTLSYEADTLTVTVHNKTVTGTDPVSGGHGLRAMRERITQVGGTLTTGAVGGHWHVEARVPA
ncbi:sensor histidine kinase [Micromonospora sp. NPDC005806]|uniref:sensor histidine kinase n=1 Tax=Micromonospora sp. NPDC005806 TaxID=3364234 RepID=UPI00368252A9